MAHKYRIVTRPHENVDGTISKTKKDHVVLHRGRGGSYEVGSASSHAKAVTMQREHRAKLILRHRLLNPNDLAHATKHGYNEQEK